MVNGRACLGALVAFLVSSLLVSVSIPAAAADLVVVRLSYTYAELPTAGLSSSQILRLGGPERPSPGSEARFKEVDANVGGLLAEAARVVAEATRHRIKFGDFRRVDDIAEADVVVSLTATQGRWGWATPGGYAPGLKATSDRPQPRIGGVGLYYESLKAERAEDAILIIAHLLSHYLFDLPDELADGGAQAACPRQNPQGPGCLMDNFFSEGPRRGFQGKYCGADHNPDAPTASSLSRVQKPTESCQDHIERFLKHPGHEKTTIETNAPTAIGLQALENAAKAHVRAEMEKHSVWANRRSLRGGDWSARRLNEIAWTFLSQQRSVRSRDADFGPKMTDAEFAAALSRIIDSVQLEPPRRPAKFDAGLMGKLRKVAANQSWFYQNTWAETNPGVNFARDYPEYLAPIVKADAINHLADPNVASLLVSDAPGPNSLEPIDERFIESVVRAELARVAQSVAGESPQNAKPTASDEEGEAATDSPEPETRLLFLAPEAKEPLRLNIAPEFVSKLAVRSELAIFLGLAPPFTMALELDFQGIFGELVPYKSVRQVVMHLLENPVGRRPIRVMTLETNFFQGNWLKVESELAVGKPDHIMLLIPPGQSALNTDDGLKRLEWLSKRVQRLHIVKIGDDPLAPEPRKLAATTGGRVVAAANLHDLPAAVQRVRAEIASESLVSIPEEGAIDLRKAAALFSKKPLQGADAAGSQSRSDLRIRKVGADLLEVEFQPFQASDGDACEFLLAFSRPLMGFDRALEREEMTPRLVLYRDGEITDQPFLGLHPAGSNSRLLNFRTTAVRVDEKPENEEGLVSGLPRGEYTPKLLIHRALLPPMRLLGPASQPSDDSLFCALSIASRSSPTRLIARFQAPASTGIVGKDARMIVIEAGVVAGAPVLDVDIQGRFRRPRRGAPGMETFGFDFRDDGVHPDLRANDGVHTARVVLPPAAEREAADYEFFVEARSRATSKFAPLIDPAMRFGPLSGATAKEAETIPVPAFQRATSIETGVAGQPPK